MDSHKSKVSSAAHHRLTYAKSSHIPKIAASLATEGSHLQNNHSFLSLKSKLGTRSIPKISRRRRSIKHELTETRHPGRSAAPTMAGSESQSLASPPRLLPLGATSATVPEKHPRRHGARAPGAAPPPRRRTEVESSSSVAAARGDASTFAAAGCRGARGRLRRRRGLLLLGLRWHGGGWGGAASGEVTRFGALVGFKFFFKKK